MDKPPIIKTKLILDTNIISYASNYPVERQDKMLKIIDNYRAKYDPVITDYIQFELLKSAENKDSELLKKLGLFGKLSTNEAIILMAGVLHGVYKKAKIERKINDGDLIIATTAILSQSLLLTADKDDYPHPFFEEKECLTISFKEFKNSHTTSVIPIYLFEPNQTKTLQEVDKFFKIPTS